MRGREWRENGLERWIPWDLNTCSHTECSLHSDRKWLRPLIRLEKVNNCLHFFPPPSHSLSFSQHIQRCSDEHYIKKWRAEVNYFQSHWLAAVISRSQGKEIFWFYQKVWLTVFFSSCECESIWIYLEFIFFKKCNMCLDIFRYIQIYIQILSHSQGNKVIFKYDT